MSREVTVVTPENITISYELAGLGSRAMANILDLTLQFTAMITFYIVTGIIVASLLSWSPTSKPLRFVADSAFAIILVGVFLIFIGYFIYFEGFRHGQTPGKKWLGLRVIREEGSPIDLSSAVIRNLVRLVEMALFFHLSSLLFILFSPKYKRLGDYAAGTIVVKERAPNVAEIILESRPAAPRSQSNKLEAMYVKDVDLLTPAELEAVRRFVSRRHELGPEVQNQIAKQIGEPITTRLGITLPQTEFHWADYLDEVYIRCTEERGVL